MKANRSFLAFLAALALHILILLLIVYLTRYEKDRQPPKPEKRFGVMIGEEPSLSEEILSPRSSPSPPPSSPQRHRKAPGLREGLPQVPPPAVFEETSEVRQITPEQRDALPRSVLHHYGETFFELSAGEQHYIIDNLQRIRKINEIVGTRLLRERDDTEIDPADSNVVEFTLHPDGSISDLHLHKNRVGTFLDELTLQTISLAHPRYPKPGQPTLIRIRVYIVVR